jgi:hypothetical protein
VNIFLNKKEFRVLITEDKAPILFESTKLINDSLHTGPLEKKYMSLFKAYECLSDKKLITFSSIRHSLSHSRVSLTHKKTLDILIKLFGSTEINLKNSKHRRIFYDNYARLLIEVDKIFFWTIKRHIREGRIIKMNNVIIIDERKKHPLEKNKQARLNQF